MIHSIFLFLAESFFSWQNCFSAYHLVRSNHLVGPYCLHRVGPHHIVLVGSYLLVHFHYFIGHSVQITCWCHIVVSTSFIIFHASLRHHHDLTRSWCLQHWVGSLHHLMVGSKHWVGSYHLHLLHRFHIYIYIYISLDHIAHHHHIWWVVSSTPIVILVSIGVHRSLALGPHLHLHLSSDGIWDYKKTSICNILAQLGLCLSSIFDNIKLQLKEKNTQYSHDWDWET